MPEDKFDAHTRDMGEELHKDYLRLFDNWRKNKERDGLPLALSENFFLSLAETSEGFGDRSEPKAGFVFINKFGFLEVFVWCVNQEEKCLVTSSVVYTQGLDKNVKGKGQEALGKLHHIFKTLSNISGYTIYRVDLPNKASAGVLTPELGYDYLDDSRQKEIAGKISEEDISRWEKLSATARHRGARLKKYFPEQNVKPTLQEEREIKKIMEVARIG